MQTILRAEGRRLYFPGPDGIGLESQLLGTAQAAMDRLLAILQVHTGRPRTMPAVGVHVYGSDFCYDYLVLAVTDRSATVYSATFWDLARHNLPAPQRPRMATC